MRKQIVRVLLMLVLVCLPGAALANENKSVSELSQEASQAQTSEAMVQAMHDAFEAMKVEAQADATRNREVTPEVIEFGEDEDEGEEPDDLDFPVCTITRNGKTMKYLLSIKGDPDESGYPLYIALHGGGNSTSEENDMQWSSMYEYYRGSVDHGIYVACRGMEDVWNMHSLPDTYAMYDRIVEDMVLLKNADPNRVYLLGFSAGGDGVYEVTPHMADRFAAANMSSGHPNSVSLLNVANVPFEIQVGVRDFYSESAMRCVRGAAFQTILNNYNNRFGFGYEHRVLVHVPEGHNFNDCSELSNPNSLVLADPALYAKRAVDEDWLESFVQIYDSYYPPDPEDEDSFDEQVSEMSYLSEDRVTMLLTNEAEKQAAIKNFNDYIAALTQKLTGTGEGEYGMQTETVNTDAVHYVNKFTRSYCPNHVVWDLATRAETRDVSSFYWLRADKTLNKGLIEASFDAETNKFTLRPSDEVTGDFSLLINPHMVDVSRPVILDTPKGVFTINVKADAQTVEASLREVTDPYLAWIQEISYQQLNDSDDQKSAPSLMGKGHIQTYGDKDAQASDNGIAVGTTGEAKRLESFRISLADNTDGTLSYRGHIQGTGWTDWCAENTDCGTTGQAKRLEAVEIQLAGNTASDYSVWYRAHSQTYGWLGWAHDGEAAGTSGQSKRCEAIEVVILPNDQKPVGYVAGQASYVGYILGEAHVQTYGWMGTQQSGIIGTTGIAKRLEAIKLDLGNQPVSGGISYEVHVSGRGWTPSAANGAQAGTTGEARRAEAVRVSLTGDMAKQFCVWYRIHSQTHGWLGWTHDGSDAGTTGLAKRAEAMELQILPAGQVPKDYDANAVACING